jgi:hypothetical protein
MSKLVENFFLKTVVTASTGEAFLCPSVAMGDHNGAMYEVWLVSHTNLKNSTSPYGLVAIVEASNDGLYWTEVTGFSVPFQANASTAQLYYLSVQETSIIIPQAYVRLKFVMVAETGTATALLHADIRTYRAS